MDRKAEIERAANIVTTARGISRRDAIKVATAAITPLLDKIEALEREVLEDIAFDVG